MNDKPCICSTAPSEPDYTRYKTCPEHGDVARGVFAQRTVDKPWGHELIWAKTDRYVGKILHVRAGEALSLQYHRVKDETVMVLSGRLRFEVFAEGQDPQMRELGPREPFHVTPGLRHRMIALEDTDVIEVSTPELDDVVRLEDRYGRSGTSAP